MNTHNFLLHVKTDLEIVVFLLKAHFKIEMSHKNFHRITFYVYHTSPGD